MARDPPQPSFVLNKCPVCGRVTGVLTRVSHGAVTRELCDPCRLSAPGGGGSAGAPDTPSADEAEA